MQLDVDDLPREPALRFKKLFSIKPTWTLEELVPCVRSLVPVGGSVEKLVLLHARPVTAIDGSRTYVARFT